jgi:type 1 glutamine amidotransferase
MKIKSGALSVCLVLQLSAFVQGQLKNPDGVPVLLLSGGQRQHHGYRDQAAFLSKFLEETGKYRVTIVEDAGILELLSLEKYRVIIMLADRRDPEFRLTEIQQNRLTEFVKRRTDGGLISIHGADNAAPDWVPEMRTMLGGVFSHDTRGGRPDGKTRKGDYHVHVAQPNHPICKGISDFQVNDELYYNIQFERPVEPLLSIEFNGTEWPVAWVNEFGQGRVFHTVLGHRDFGADKHDPLRAPNVTRVIEQALAWVAEKRP